MAGHTVVVSVLADTKKFAAGMKGATSTMQKMGGAFKATAAVAVASLAVIGAVAVKAVRSASDVEQSWGAIEQIFGDQTSTLRKWANDAAMAVGMSAKSYAGLAVGLGNALRGYGVKGEQLATKTNDLLMRSADIAAMYGGTAEEVAASITSAYRGEYDAVQKYIPTINAAAVEKEMQLKNISKEQAIFNLVMEGTAIAEGQAAREAKTFAGVMARISAIFGNIRDAVGTALLPAFAAGGAALIRLTAAFLDTKAFETFMKFIGEGAEKVAAFFDALQFNAGGIDGFLGVLSDFAPLLGGLLIPLSGLLSKLPLIGGAFSGLAALAGPLGILVAVIAGLLTADAGAMEATFSKLAESLPAMLVDMVTKAVGVITTLVPQLVAKLVENIPVFVDGILAVITALAGTLPTLLPLIITAIVSMVPALVEGAVTLFNGLIEGLMVALPLLVEAITTSLPMVAAALVGALPVILEGAITLFMALVEAIPVILPPLLVAILDLLPSLVEAILEMLPAILQAAITLFIALVDSLPIVLPKILAAIIGMLPKLVATILRLTPQILATAVILFLALVDGLARALPSILGALLAMGPKMIAELGKIDLGKAGKAIMDGFLGGLKASWTKVTDFVGGIAAWIRNNKGPIEKDRHLLEPAGDAIMGGFLGSLKDGWGDVQRLVDGFAPGLAGALGGVTMAAPAGATVNVYQFGDVALSAANDAEASLLDEFAQFLRRKARAA